MNRVIGQKGFSVMELLIVISIVMILSGIAALSISEYRKRTELREGARVLEGFFYEARTAARARQRTVWIDLTPSDGVAYIIDRPSPPPPAIPPIQTPPYDPADDIFIKSFQVGGRLDLQAESEPPGFAVPGSMAFTGSGRLNTTDIRRIIIVRSLSDPSRQYRVNVYQPGGTRVEMSEDNGVNWSRAW